MKNQTIIAILLGVTAARNNNKLIRVWDNLNIYDATNGTLTASYNMTSFPYIENVSPASLTLFVSTN